MNKKMRTIGIPKSLLYYYYYPFWKTLFKNLGFQILVSEATSEKILNKGVKNSISEICVPMKIYIGQVRDLQKKGVDYIYIPRFVSIKKGITFCPKFLGLPDMIENSLKEMEGLILSNKIKADSDDISDFKHYKSFQEELNVGKRELRKALKLAQQEWIKFRKSHQEGLTIDKALPDSVCCSESNDEVKNQERDKKDNQVTIGLLGYVYNVYDNYINMDLLDRLRQLNIDVVTFEMLDEKVIEKELASFDKKMFWQFTNKIMGAGYHFIKSPNIDGIIHISAFGCGPDSILGPFLETDVDKAGKPFMTLRIDEQTGESHLITRIEAFTDLIKLKKDVRVV